jgi:hypothetical protein
MGRLIDADALTEKYGDWYTEEGTEEGYIGTIKGIVESMPTIEERKKGKWKRAYLDHEAMGERLNILYCSVCNQCIAYPTNYCPNCGSYNGGNDDGDE